jgi:integrase
MRQLRAGDTLSGRPAAESTIRGYLVSLSAAFTHAIHAKWLRDNPVSEVPNKPSKQARKKDFRLIDAERELPRFLETCNEVEPELLRFCLALLETGARRGEMLAVRWRDIDLKSGMITIWKAKGGKRRTVHVRRLALEVLRERYEELEPGLDGKVFWPELEGERRPRHASYVFDKARKLSGIEVTIHGLRHAFASYLIMSGTDLKTVSTLLGHSSIDVTADVYSHLTGTHLGDAVDRMAKRFLSQVNGD